MRKSLAVGAHFCSINAVDNQQSPISDRAGFSAAGLVMKIRMVSSLSASNIS